MPLKLHSVWHTLLSEVSDESTRQKPSPEPVATVPVEPELTPPPLVQADPIKPKPKPKKKPPTPSKSTQPPVPPPAPVPKKRPAPYKPEPPEEYGILQYLKDDFIDTTMKESMPLISKWFGRVGKALEYVPGLKGVGKGYQAIAEIADGLQLVYELVHELNQAEALEKGSKQVVKRVKPVKKIAEGLIKKKYPNLPEPARKKAAEILEDLFEKYGSDPAIEKGRKKAQDLDEGKELEKSLYEKLKKTLSAAPVLQ